MRDWVRLTGQLPGELYQASASSDKQTPAAHAPLVVCLMSPKLAKISCICLYFSIPAALYAHSFSLRGHRAHA